MTGYGTAGSWADHDVGDFPGVPYVPSDFNARCSMNWNDPPTLRNCELDTLRDLNQAQETVRTAIVNYMNHLIDLGVAGFRKCFLSSLTEIFVNI